MRDERQRCEWVGSSSAMIAYHDREWGVPVHDDRTLFELLILEGAQAGLSWATILGKRRRYRELFEEFDPEAVARFGDRRVEKILRDPGIVRNRLKVMSAVTNARAFLAVQEERGSFDAFLWEFVGGEPRVNSPGRLDDVPVSTPESDALSGELKRRGFKFVGSTICYAYMQAAGLVNDHVTSCFRWPELKAGREGRR